MTGEPVFPLLDKKDLPPELHDAWDASVARRGEARFVSGIAHAPHLFDWYSRAFYGALFRSEHVPVRAKELGRLRLSTRHGCRSCNRGNRLDAREHGLSDEQITNIDNENHPCFDAADRAVLALADLVSMHNDGQQLDVPTYRALSAHYSDGQIVELAMTFAFLSGMARFLFAFDLVEKEDHCTF